MARRASDLIIAQPIIAVEAIVAVESIVAIVVYHRRSPSSHFQRVLHTETCLAHILYLALVPIPPQDRLVLTGVVQPERPAALGGAELVSPPSIELSGVNAYVELERLDIWSDTTPGLPSSGPEADGLTSSEPEIDGAMDDVTES